MVSNARELFPDPESPVTTVSLSRGISTSMLRRLCSRAPRMISFSSGIDPKIDRWGVRRQDSPFRPRGVPAPATPLPDAREPRPVDQGARAAPRRVQPLVLRPHPVAARFRQILCRGEERVLAGPDEAPGALDALPGALAEPE